MYRAVVLGRLGMFVVLIICGIQLLVRYRRRDLTTGGAQRTALLWTGAAFIVAQFAPPTITMIGVGWLSPAAAFWNAFDGLIIGLMMMLLLLNQNIDPTPVSPTRDAGAQR